jgi:hypothetical protein
MAVFLGDKQIIIATLGDKPLQYLNTAESIVDIDAANFLTASGLQNDTTIKYAINSFVQDLKGNNLWDKLYVAYPLVGSTSQSQAINLVDTGSYNITWYSSSFWGFDSNGATSDAANLTFATTNWAPTDAPTPFSDTAHLSVYSRTDNVGGYDMGGEQTGTQGNQTAIAIQFDSASVDYFIPGLPTSDVTASLGTSLGFFQASRIGTSLAGYRNGSLVASGTVSAGPFFNHSVELYIGATNNSGIIDVSEYTSRNYTFFSIGSGMDSDEVSKYYTAVQNLQISLNREV